MTFITSCIILFSSCGLDRKNSNDSNTDKVNDEKIAKAELTLALKDTTHDRFVDTQRVIIKDKKMAISIVEPILFDIYGKDKITEQRPYKIFNIDNYWVISGTMPSRFEKGGTFLIIIDSRNCRILKIKHGK